MKKESQTLLEIAKQFYDYKELHNKQNKKTRARVETRIKEHFIGLKPLKTISKADIENFQVEIEHGLEPATVNLFDSL